MVSLTAGRPRRQQQPAPAAPAAAPVQGVPSGQQPGQPARASGTQPTPPVTFKTEVNYVEVDALVTDAQGNFVGGLTKDDFEVLEDDKPQKVELFTEINIPVEKPERFLYSQRVIPPDTKTNRDPFRGGCTSSCSTTCTPTRCARRWSSARRSSSSTRTSAPTIWRPSSPRAA